MLNELKENAAKPNAAKRTKKSKQQIIAAPASSDNIDRGTTNKIKRKLRKTTSEIITSSQATRAISTVQT